jgi:putative Ca2+/H+ antiporter (TMEM165/GDT1 family)
VVIRQLPGRGTIMEALLVSTGVVTLAEIGDKTQLLAFILAARFKKPLPTIAGILVATLANHGLAGALGAWITAAINPRVLRWLLGLSFLAMAIWTMIPDEIENDETQVARRFAIFGATLITFFLAEMGDKTQLATVAMVAHYGTPVLVVIGTTLGMLLEDVPAVFVGNKLAAKIPMKPVHSVAAAIFALLGIATLLGAGAKLVCDFEISPTAGRGDAEFSPPAAKRTHTLPRCWLANNRTLAESRVSICNPRLKLNYPVPCFRGGKPERHHERFHCKQSSHFGHTDRHVVRSVCSESS